MNLEEVAKSIEATNQAVAKLADLVTAQRAQPAAAQNTGNQAAASALDPEKEINDMRIARIRDGEMLVENERKRQLEISALCAKHNVPDTTRIRMLSTDCKVEDAKTQVLAWLETQSNARSPDAPIFVGEEEKDKFREHATAALLLRCGHPEALKNPKAQNHDLAGMNFRDLSHKALRMAGQKVSGDDRPNFLGVVVSCASDKLP